MILYVDVQAPYRWAIVDRRGEVSDSGTADSLAAVEVPKKVSQVVGVIPGSRVTVHTVDLPARTRGKAVASAPYALEEKLAADIEDLVFSLLDWKAGQSATVSVAEKSYIDSIENEFVSIDRRMDALVPDFLLVPLHKQAEITLVKTADGSFVLRTGRFSGTVFDSDTLEYWWQSVNNPHISVAVNENETAKQLVEWGGTAIREWPVGEAFPEWLAHDRSPVESINISQRSQNEPQTQGRSAFSRVAIALFIFGVLAKIGLDLYDNYQLYYENKRLDEEIVAVFQEAFPNVKRIVNPRLQMTQLVREMKSGAVDAGEFQLLMSLVAQAVPKASAKLEEISFRDNMLTITCTTKDFAGLDLLKQQLADDERIRAELISSGSRDNRVSARFELKRV